MYVFDCPNSARYIDLGLVRHLGQSLLVVITAWLRFALLLQRLPFMRHTVGRDAGSLGLLQ